MVCSFSLGQWLQGGGLSKRRLLQVLEDWVERLHLEVFLRHSGSDVDTNSRLWNMGKGEDFGNSGVSSNLKMQIWVWGCSLDLDKGGVNSH